MFELSLGILVALHFRKVCVLWKLLVMGIGFGGNLREREREGDVAINFFFFFFVCVGRAQDSSQS